MVSPEEKFRRAIADGQVVLNLSSLSKYDVIDCYWVAYVSKTPLRVVGMHINSIKVELNPCPECGHVHTPILSATQFDLLTEYIGIEEIW